MDTLSSNPFFQKIEISFSASGCNNGVALPAVACRPVYPQGICCVLAGKIRVTGSFQMAKAILVVRAERQLLQNAQPGLNHCTAGCGRHERAKWPCC
jgi:hypothetical protein